MSETVSSMVNTRNNTTHDMIDAIQKLGDKTKLTFYQFISNYFGEMNYRR